jgi:hypothetical protein
MRAGDSLPGLIGFKFNMAVAVVAGAFRIHGFI